MMQMQLETLWYWKKSSHVNKTGNALGQKRGHRKMMLKEDSAYVTLGQCCLEVVEAEP
jgi:hypothetical protein